MDNPDHPKSQTEEPPIRRQELESQEPEYSVVSAEYTGPLPLPQDFREFEEILPGAADRILGMAEQNQILQHEATMALIQANSGSEKRGQWFGFIVALMGFMVFCLASALSVYFMRLGITAYGLYLLLSAIGGLVTPFLISLAYFLNRRKTEASAASNFGMPTRPIISRRETENLKQD